MQASSPLRLDPATLLFAIAALGFVMAGLSLSLARTAPAQRLALFDWAACMAAAGVAFSLYFLRAELPWALGFVGANLAVLAVPALLHRAYSRLLGAPLRGRASAAVVAFGATGVLLSTFAELPTDVTAFTVSTSTAALLSMTAWTIARSPGPLTPPMGFAAIGLAVAGVGFAARAVLSAGGDGTSMSPTSDSAAHTAFLVLGALAGVATTIGFTLIVHDQQHAAAIECTRRDSLTGLYTRTAFFELCTEIDRAEPDPRYAIVMFDLDHFKSVNDTFGHPAGDATLAHAARLIASLTRLSDVAGRYGGEEFCVLMRDCGEAEAASFASRVVAVAGNESVRLRDGRSIPFTLSAGYAATPAGKAAAEERETLLDVIDRADRALYEAKRGGRNRAIAARPLDATAQRPA